MKPQDLVSLIDSLAPINNAVRVEKNAIKKIEEVWKMGSLLDNFIRKNKLTLDKLLYSIYDPHATIKRSNITRSLGSYSYRVFHYFSKKEDIRRLLPNLKSYNIFIEALPLLSNKKYIPFIKKENILSLINSKLSTRQIIDKLYIIKQSILPTRKLLISPEQLYLEDKQFLNLIIKYLSNIYKTINSTSELNNLQFDLGDIKYREQLVSILMALSSDTFVDKIKVWNESDISNSLRNLFRIGIGDNENRARFRKWVLSSSKLLWLAEAIHALSNDSDFRYFKKKLIK